MRKQRLLVISLSFAIVASMVMFAVTAINPANAGGTNDGRINADIPWVNSFGAVAVYCVDAYGHAAGTYANGGGILVWSSNGQRVLYAPQSAIDAASNKTTYSYSPVVVVRGPVYTLTAQPYGYFELTTIPDAEGKTFLGQWQNCSTALSGTPTPSAGSAPACVANPFARNEANNGASCGQCFNGKDDDCNGLADAADYSCRYYCGR